jgi:DNA polymerase I
MKLQIFDCDYILINNKPTIRIFCKDEKGGTVCVFKEDFLPYFYLNADENDFDHIISEINSKYPRLKVEIVERTITQGYQEPKKVLKIIGDNPILTREIREFTSHFGTPYEADILFKYRFMADHGLHGMQWIEVEGTPQRTSTVKCRAIAAEKITPIEEKKNAPLRFMSLDIECFPKEMRIPDAEKDEIVMVGLSFHPEYKGKESLVLLAKRTKSYPDTVSCNNEKEMLEKLKNIIEDYDPDIIGGHNINGFDLPFIIKRLEVLNVASDFGRSEKKMFSRKLTYSSIPSMSGRVIVDTYEILKRDPWVKFKRYDLGTVSRQMLGMDKLKLKDNTVKEIIEAWKGNGRIKEIIDYNRRDADLVKRIVVEKHLLDKFFEISKACGLLLQDSLGGQAQRHEFKLLEKFHERNYLMPCRPRNVDYGSDTLKGAIVLEPEVGFHEWIICLDFTSMYPSLIQAFNICTTTFIKEETDLEYRFTPYGAKFVKSSVRKGVIPEVLKEYMERRAIARKQYRKETNKENKRLLRAEQLALKDLANSLYGYTGYARSRLFIMDIANAITSLGRDAITRTKKLVEENFPAKVLYADTDSIFLKTDIKDLDEARKFGDEISKFISGKLYGLDLKFEKTYKTFLILAKKRYAGWAFEKENGEWVGKIDMKGIETVRRDWCDLLTETLSEVLDTILKEKDIKRASKHVREVINQLAEGKVDLEKLAVRKGVSKALDKYDGIQPHVELAKKILKRDKTRTVVGQRLEYVIIRGNQMLSKRSEELDYVREHGLQIDSNYYIHSQLLPPILRIFEACGITSSELIEGVRQKSLFDAVNKKEKGPEEIVLKKFDSIVCRKCSWSFRRPTLSGHCPKCSDKIYFSGDGFIGATVQFS